MYNPLKTLDDAFRKGGLREKYNRQKLHPILSWYEILAFLSFVPGLFIFLGASTIIVAFVLSAASVLACSEIEKGRYIIAGFILSLFNLLPALFALFYIVVEAANVQLILAVVLYGLLGSWGFVALRAQQAQRKGNV
ncbi:hypothetical protein [Aurantivibrio plasticivorans]